MSDASNEPAPVRRAKPFVRSPKVPELVATELAHQILDARLPVGARLPHESEMMQELSVGRSTLREALRLLEFQGLLRIKTGRHGGPTVARPSREQAGHFLALLLHVEDATIEHVYDVRKVIEPLAAQMAAGRVSEEALGNLSASCEAVRSNIGDLDLFEEESASFHRQLAEACGNPVVLVVVEGLTALSLRSEMGIVYDESVRLSTVKSHDRILKALRKGDSSAAQRAMATHLEDMQRDIEAFYPGTMASPVPWSLRSR